MQQNVQSQRPLEAADYSQQRNSNPSKIPDSQLIPNHRSTASFCENPIQLQIHEPKQQSNNEQSDELKKINQQIQKQKELIEKLRLQKQQIQNNMNKSYLSLSPHLLDPRNDDSVPPHDDLLETKTQADMSFLENRKIVATRQLQTEEEKYRENIRKMQLKKSQMKRKLKQDPEIPIKIMDFKQLQKKKQSKEDEQQNISNNKSIHQDKSPQKQPSQKQENLQQMDPIIIETQSKKPTSEKVQQNQQPIQQSQKSKQVDENIDQIKKPETSQKGSELINKSKFSQKKSQYKVEEQNANENKSRISENSKRYSVKKSSVIVPESNESIKEIQERRQRQSQKLSSQKQNNPEPSQEINLAPEASQNSRSRVSSIKESQAKESVHSQKDSDHKQKQQESFKSKNSIKESQRPQTIHQELQVKVEKGEEKSVRSQKFQNTEQVVQETGSVKQKTSSVKSKKSQKVELMYVPHAPKQPSHKSFKKTDKSIQWSEVDMSMYGKTNEVPHSHNNSQLLSQLNQQNHPLKQETQESRVSNSMEMNQVNMKKNKTQDKILVEESSQKNNVTQKGSNLAPLKSNKEKSERQSIHSKPSQSKGSLFAASRQGSVKQKAERYDQFHREHSLNNKKVQNKKLAMMENLNSASGNKPSSYRSRKSNPISNLSASRSKAQTVFVNEGKSVSKAGKSQVVKNQTFEMNESKVLISKKEISLLHTQIQKLEEKLLTIEAKQQKLAKQKNEELVKLQEIAVQEEKMAEEAQNSRILTQNQQKDQFQNLLVNILIPQQQSVSIQLVEGENLGQAQKDVDQAPKEEVKNQINMEKSFISEKNNIQKQIDQIAEIEKKFNQEKEELLEEINKLRKTVRELQIQKIKSIDHNQTITSKDDKSKRQDTEINQFGVIVHQSKMNRTIDPIVIGDQEESGTVPIGKIVKNQSPEKNGSRLIENLDSRTKSIDRKFRINISKKSSIMSDNHIGKQQDSVQMQAKGMSSLNYDEEGNEQLQKKKKEFYPINAKEGYVVVSPDRHHDEQAVNQKDLHFPAQKQEIKLPDISESKVRRAELMKEEILQKFHRTNREFNNFIESSRIINETNSSMSSQNNFFFDKTHSSAFSHKKAVNHEEEDNPQTTKFLNKMSDSNLEIHKDASINDFQQNFTKIIENIKNQATEQNESDDELQEIEVRDVEMPQLSKTPDITYDQDHLMKLAQETFKVFGIEVSYDDADFKMKKYKNCVIFTKGTETILWHYNGKFYIGGWKGKDDGSGEKTGYGVEIAPEKHIYKGQFMNGKKHGTGIMKSSNGNIYDGQWIEGIKNGQGVYYDSTTKVVYSGEWKDGKKNGFGILKFSQKEYYKGTFVKSVKDGYGIEVFINGDKYKGEYRKGKFHGKGKYTWANTSSFEGDFFEGMRHGNGSWKSAKINGDIYVGAYQNDKKSGYGRYIWSNGCIYEGNFAEDVKHGKGRLIYTDGKQIKGVWEEGTLLEAVTENSKEYNQQQILKRGSKIKAK